MRCLYLKFSHMRSSIYLLNFFLFSLKISPNDENTFKKYHSELVSMIQPSEHSSLLPTKKKINTCNS